MPRLFGSLGNFEVQVERKRVAACGLRVVQVANAHTVGSSHTPCAKTWDAWLRGRGLDAQTGGCVNLGAQNGGSHSCRLPWLIGTGGREYDMLATYEPTKIEMIRQCAYTAADLQLGQRCELCGVQGKARKL